MTTARAALACLAALWLAPVAHATPPVEEDYVLHCAGCHGFDGSGTSVAPSLRRLGPLARTEAGRRYLARVPGAAQAPIDDARLARLLDWVIADLSGVKGAQPYDPAEVGRLRRDPLRDAPAARAALDLP